ncbi:MAG: helix-turn-helix domain-containing protein [Sarcina sp.]
MTKRYTKDIKFKAVQMYINDKIGSTTIAKKLELSSEKRVLLWVKRYKEFGDAGLDERRGKKFN